jgi:hypothetical protein
MWNVCGRDCAGIGRNKAPAGEPAHAEHGEFSPLSRRLVYHRLRLTHASQQVLGVNLNRSESEASIVGNRPFIKAAQCLALPQARVVARANSDRLQTVLKTSDSSLVVFHDGREVVENLAITGSAWRERIF